MGPRVPVAVLAAVVLATAGSSSSGSRPCDVSGTCEVPDETSLLARPGGLTRGRLVQESPGAGCTKIGTLALDGYYWPTQPGDVNDVRTFCRVKPEDLDDFNYSCELPYREDEYGTVISIVENFTFAVAKKARTEGMKQSFRNAVQYLLEDPEVCAIICNVGFCAFFQNIAEEAVTEILAENPLLARKPMLLGSPLLALEYIPSQLPLLIKKPVMPPKKKGEVIVILTADFPSLVHELIPLFDSVLNATTSSKARPSLVGMDDAIREFLHTKVGMTCPKSMALACMRILERMHGGAVPRSDMIAALVGKNESTRTFRESSIYVIGWNQMPGYKPVDLGGSFHNAVLTSQNYRKYKHGGLDGVKKIIEASGRSIAGVILESTEQATNANDIRIDFKVPVWDFSTMGICLGAAAKGDFDASDPRILNAVFSSTAFADCLKRWAACGKVEPKFGMQKNGKFLHYENFTKEEVLSLTCNGGRLAGHPKIGRLMRLFDTGVPDHTPILEVCETTELCKCQGENELSVGCPEACPGSANCGGGTTPYPCGATGKECANETNVPPRASDCPTLGPASRFWHMSGNDLEVEGTE